MITLGLAEPREIPPRTEGRPRRRNVPLLICGALPVAAVPVALVLWILPSPHTRLMYMIAGSAGTAIWLGLALAILVRHWPAATFTQQRRPTPDAAGANTR